MDKHLIEDLRRNHEAIGRSESIYSRAIAEIERLRERLNAADKYIQDAKREIPEITSGERLSDAVWRLRESRDAYSKRVALFYKCQSELPEPVRTVVCNILANGSMTPVDSAGDEARKEYIRERYGNGFPWGITDAG